MRNIQWMKDTLFAHRGFHNNAKNIPENSILAFKKAFDKGYGIEFDLRYLNDNSLIVFHDKTLTRLAKIDMDVDNFQYKDLKQIKLLKSEEHIPLYEELLRELPKGTPMLIEFKGNKNYKKMVDAFLKITNYQEVVFAIQSFDPRIIYYFKKKAPHIIRGQIAESVKSKKTLKNFFTNLFIYNPFTKPDFINYHFEDLPNRKMNKLKNKGITIISYTIKSQKSFDFVRSRYDNCVFEDFEPKI